jgi:hypothetical protein
MSRPFSGIDVMTEIEIGVLEACQAYVACQREMLPQLSDVLGIGESQVFYHWALRRAFRPGKLANADWTYFFHGLECDFRNLRDDRVLRMDFGPKGTIGILNDWGVLRFIMTSVSPWPEFPKLKAYFTMSDTPPTENTGDWQKLSRMWSGLTDQGFFQQADPELVKRLANYTTRGPDGLNYVRLPPEISEELRADMNVAHRQQLSQKAIHCLQARIPENTRLTDSALDIPTHAILTK